MSNVQRYEIKDLIAAGGMAEVYRGQSAGIEGFRKKVAIKRVLPKLSANQEFINMFLDEARLCAYLNHGKCVQVFDIGQGGGSHFIVMEYVEGADLKAVLDYLTALGQEMAPATACLIAMQICEGLAYAHAACDHFGNPLQIVHRDISPHNVLMTNHGEVKLVDFGLAKASSHLTAEDEDIVKGKFGYLAPEVTLRQGVDHRVDIFAAGILLWEMLAGRRLFLGANDLETFKQVQAANIPNIRELRGDVPESLRIVLSRALARDRDQRYQTADDFARDLAVVLARMGEPVTYLDVATIVRAAASAKASEKTPPPEKDREGVIGELILDALHEFSGDDESSEAEADTAAPPPLTEGYEDPTAWGFDAEFDELFDTPPQVPSLRSPVPSSPRSLRPTSLRPASLRPAPPGPASPRPRTAAKPATRSLPPRARTQAAPGQDGDRPSDASGPWWRRWFG